MVRSFTVLVLSAVLARAAGAQSRQPTADSLYDALKPAEALALYEDALRRDSVSYDLLWKAGRAAVDVAKLLEEDSRARQARDSLYGLARGYAEAAVRADSMGSEGHFVLALALGRLSRTKGGRDRVRYGRLIYDEAALALALPGRHDGAEHILGAWHAEVERLSSLSRFFARTFFGAGFLSRASWDSAVVHLEAAVALRPTYIYHRLELARVYVDLGRYGDAEAQLAAVAPLPPTSDVLDQKYKREAADLLAEVRRKVGG